MKQIKAIIMLFIGIPVAILSWIISLPYLLFTLPIRWYNKVLYGEPKTELRIKDVGDKFIILFPNGRKVVAKKEVENGEQKN